MLHHVADELLRYLFEHLGSKVSTEDGILVLYELYDVARCLATVVSQTTTVAIESFHRAKISIANADNND